MRDSKQYWQEIRAIQAELPEFVWLVSLENPVHGFRGTDGPGRGAAGRAVAAREIASSRHRDGN
jgi:hypothetical protein